jgi:hypothetical protein
MFCYPHCYPTIPQYKILLSAGYTLVTIRDAGTQPAIPTPPLKSGPEHYPDAATSLFDDDDPHTRPSRGRLSTLFPFGRARSNERPAQVSSRYLPSLIRRSKRLGPVGCAGVGGYREVVGGPPYNL